MKNINKFYALLITMTFGFPLIGLANAESFLDSPSLFDGSGSFNFADSNTNSGDNSFYKDDGSLVIIRGAKDSGLIVRGTDEGTETEYYVIPKDDGSKTFIYDEGLTVCDSNGCY
jgi:hypothetical protein